MKTLTTLKTLPLIGLLAAGLALSPTLSMADDDDRGRGKDRVYQKHDGGKGHYRDGGKSHRRDKGHFDRGHRYNKGHSKGHSKGHNKGHNKGHKSVDRHAHSYNKGHGHKHHAYKHHGHTHKVYRPHRHDHGHVDHVIVQNHYDHLNDYDRFRLMFGLHLDNIDIIYRDF